MDNENTNEAAATVETPATAAAAPTPTYVAATNIDHDRLHFKPGDIFPASVATAEQIAFLLKDGALKYAHEIEAAGRVAVEIAAKDEELNRLRAEIAALTAKAQAGKR